MAGRGAHLVFKVKNVLGWKILQTTNIGGKTGLAWASGVVVMRAASLPHLHT